MAYQRVNWEDSPSTVTPLTAENLNKMDEGIEQNSLDCEANKASVQSLETGQKNLSAKIEQNTTDIETIKANEKTFEKSLDLGTVTSLQTLINYKSTGTLYTGSIAFTADFTGTFVMWIVQMKRFLLCSDGAFWVFESLTTNTATKVTYSVDDVNKALAKKQDTLVLDDAPTLGSTNLVNSDRIAAALSYKASAKDLSKKADKTDVETSLVVKENIANKVSDTTSVTDATQNYPSVEYLNEYYYDFAQTDDLLAQKYDSSNIEDGSGTFTVVSDSVKPFIKLATFQYQKCGKSLTLFGSVQFNEGVLPSSGYFQLSGIPFRAIANSRVVSATSKYVNAVITIVQGTWVSVNLTTSLPRVQDEQLQFSVNYLIN